MAEIIVQKTLGYSLNPNAITFDGELLQDAHIITRYARHETPAERTIATLPIARRDGSVFIMQRYGEKTIRLQGVIVGDTREDLQERIDAFKELLSREQKELAIFGGGVKRVYIATAREPIFERDHFHVTHIPWTVEFVVPTGEGQDAATTDALSAQSLDTTTPVETSFELEGTKAPRPVILIEGDNWPTDVKGIELENLDTGEKMTVTDTAAWGTDSQIEIDADAKEVNHIISAVPTLVDFYGTIPTFKIGTNNIRLTAGKLINQRTTEPDISDVSAVSAIDGDLRYAQTFRVPYTNGTFQSIRVPLRSFGSPAGNVSFAIQADSGGQPSGVDVVVMTMVASGVSGTMTYYDIVAASPFTLNANTTYWLIFYGTSMDASNGAYWGNVAAGYGYPGGTVRVSLNDGSTWQAPIVRYQAFILYYGGKAGSSDALLSVSYKKTYL